VQVAGVVSNLDTVSVVSISDTVPVSCFGVIRLTVMSLSFRTLGTWIQTATETYLPHAIYPLDSNKPQDANLRLNLTACMAKDWRAVGTEDEYNNWMQVRV
jgi:hypothetical protein